MSKFIEARSLDVGDKIKEKNKLKYLSWASAWNFMKQIYPDATYRIVKNEKDLAFVISDNTYYVPEFTPYHTDGRTCWVETEIAADGISQPQELAVMDFKNQSVPLSGIKSTDVQKSIARCLAKNCSLFGIGIYIYEGDDLPQELKEVEKLQEEIDALYVKKLKALGGDQAAKDKLLAVCVEVVPEEYNGNYKLSEDSDVLKKLKTKIAALRK